MHVAASITRVRTLRIGPVAAVVAVSLIAAGLLLASRMSAARAIAASFDQMCANVGGRPGDWFCEVSFTRSLVAHAGGALLLGLGLALPGLILTLAGRRWLSLAPLLLTTAVATIAAVVAPRDLGDQLLGLLHTGFLNSEARTWWATHPVLSVVADAVLIGAPTIAVALFLRPDRHRLPRVTRGRAFFASSVVAGSIAIVVMIIGRVEFAGYAPGRMSLGVPLAVMALFGALLGPDRRWWPWSIVPVAVLLSMGPSMLLMGGVSRLVVFSWFGGVLTLVAAGLIGSMWFPLAFGRGSLAPLRPPPGPGRVRWVRPTAMLHALAVVLVVVSMAMTAWDPVGVQLATALPTYLGVRERAQDAVAADQLRAAVTTIERHRAAAGTVGSFDLPTAQALAPELRWSRHASPQVGVVVLDRATDRSVRLLTTSASGTAICVVMSPTGTTYGVARQPSAAAQLMADARRHCGDAAFGPEVMPAPAVATLCDAADDQALPLCRSVQRRIDAMQRSVSD